jgi:glycosyltransferase involved in cell wall biosynthesis
MRIAVISTSLVPSNTANSIQVLKVCQAYVQIGHEILLIVPGGEKHEWGEIKSNYGLTQKFEIVWINSLKIFHRYDFALHAVTMARNSEANLIHTWTPQVALLLNWIKKPYLLELHELPSGRFGPRLLKTVISSGNKKRFLPITQALIDRYEDYFKFTFKADEVVVSPDGVDIERYVSSQTPQEIREKLNLPPQYTAVYTGHLYSGRGMSLLVDLAKLLPDIHFVWVGGREKDVAFWRKIINEQKITNITLTGFVKNELIPIYQMAGDIVLMPYEKNISGSGGGNTVDYCSPMKMFEYLASGRPIISSDIPVFHEVLNAHNSIFCQSDDPIAWRDEILKIRDHPEIAEKLSNQAKLDAQKYSWVKRCKDGLESF